MSDHLIEEYPGVRLSVQGWLRGPVHVNLTTIRGMCSDERPWTEIDAKLAELDDQVSQMAEALR